LNKPIYGDRFIPFRGIEPNIPNVSPDNTEEVIFSDEDSERTMNFKYTAKNYKCILKANYNPATQGNEANNLLAFAPSKS